MPQRASVMTGPGQPLEIRDFDDPDLGPGETWLEIEASEVCGTDVHLFHGRLAGVPWPIIPGHVSVGRVRETRGPGVDAAGRPLAEGDTVTFFDVVGTCHRCFYCSAARQPNLCPHRRVYGITFSAREGLLGGWATSMRLTADTSIFKLPEGLATADVIGGGCGLFTGFGAVERSDLRPGDTVVVQGSGPVGLAAAAFARVRGCGLLAVIGDPDDRLDLATAMGADVTLSLSRTSGPDRSASVADLTEGRGADVVIEASGNPAAIPEGFALLRDGGTYAWRPLHRCRPRLHQPASRHQPEARDREGALGNRTAARLARTRPARPTPPPLRPRDRGRIRPRGYPSGARRCGAARRHEGDHRSVLEIPGHPGGGLDADREDVDVVILLVADGGSVVPQQPQGSLRLDRDAHGGFAGIAS